MTQLEQDYMILACLFIGFVFGVGLVLLFDSTNRLLDGLFFLIFKKYLKPNDDKVGQCNDNNGDYGKAPN